MITLILLSASKVPVVHTNLDAIVENTIGFVHFVVVFVVVRFVSGDTTIAALHLIKYGQFLCYTLKISFLRICSTAPLRNDKDHSTPFTFMPH